MTWWVVVLAIAAGTGLGLFLGNWRCRRDLALGSHALLDLIDDGVIALSQSGKVLLANRMMARFLGLDPDAGGEKIRLALLRIPDLDRYLEQVVTGDFPDSVTVEAGYPRVRHLRVHASVVTSARGNQSVIIMTVTDVSRIEQLEQVRRRFTADLSHELRTPVTSIRLMAEALAWKGSGVEDHATRILREAGRLERLVDEVLTLSRLEAGETRFDPEWFQVSDLVDESLDWISSPASQKDVVLERHVEDVKWWGDFRRLARLLEVYLDNAVKFSPPGGRIVIRAFTDDGHLVLTVADTGPGVPVEDQPHVFHRFYKGQRQAGSPGFGLGLAIAKHAALAHRGEVFIDSQVGEGSTFGVRLPRDMPASEGE